VGMTDSNAGAREARRVRDASGNAAELHGNDGSDARTDTERKDVYAGQGHSGLSRHDADAGRATVLKARFEAMRARRSR